MLQSFLCYFIFFKKYPFFHNHLNFHWPRVQVHRKVCTHPSQAEFSGVTGSTGEVSASRCSGSLNCGKELWLWREPGPAESAEEGVVEAEVFRPAAWEEGK